MTRSGDAGVTGGCRREGAGGPSEGGARAVHGGVTPRRWHSAATALMRWDVTSAPSNHRLGGRPPQPCAPSLICPPRLRGDTKPSLPMCEGHTQAPHAVQGGGCAPPPPPSPLCPPWYPAPRSGPARCGGCGAGLRGVWVLLRGGLWGAPRVVQVARGWQQHTEHGRAPPGCARGGDTYPSQAHRSDQLPPPASPGCRPGGM